MGLERETIILTDDQSRAVSGIKDFLASDRQELVLSGAGGTGKTTVIYDVFKEERHGKEVVTNDVIGVAVAHMARLNLQRSIPNTITYASATNQIMQFDEHGNVFFKPTNNKDFSPLRGYNCVVFDECSMVSSGMQNLILDLVSFGTKIIWIGDRAQLPPIDQSGMALNEDSPTFSVSDRFDLSTKVRQQDGEAIARLGDEVRSHIFGDQSLSFLSGLKTDFDMATQKGYGIGDIDSVVKSFVHNFKSGLDLRITSFRNARVDYINNMVRRRLWGQNAQDVYVEGEFIVSNSQYAPNGDVLAYNGQTFIVKSLDFSTIEDVYCALLHVDVDGDDEVLAVPFGKGLSKHREKLTELRNEALRTGGKWGCYKNFKERFADVSYAYCVTNYKVQGSTMKACYVDLSDIMSVSALTDKRKLQAFYVGVTRPTDFLGIF